MCLPTWESTADNGSSEIAKLENLKYYTLSNVFKHLFFKNYDC
jgi:hypothetical protein